MYLTKIELDISHPSCRQALRNCNDMHKNIMSGFKQKDGTEHARAEACVVYRLIENRNSLYLLTMSGEYPDISELSKRGFILDGSSIKDVSVLTEIFTNGMRLSFELLTMPYKKVKCGVKNSRRLFLKDADERIQWLERKAEQNGFAVIQATENASVQSIIGYKDSKRIIYYPVLYNGTLEITDVEKFTYAYTNGIGAGKSYGMGMLLISRVR